MGHGSRLSDATAEPRISNEYTAPSWSWARRDQRHRVTPIYHRITHYASSFKLVFLLLLLLHLGNPWTFEMHWKMYCFLLFLSLPFCSAHFAIFFDAIHNPSCSLAHALFIFCMLSLIPRPLHLPSTTYSIFLNFAC